MSLLLSLIGIVLLLFELLLIARVVLDWVGVARPGPRPEWAQPIRRGTYAVTEPVLAPVRRVLPTPRIGSIGFDLAVPIVFVVVLILRGVVGAL